MTSINLLDILKTADIDDLRRQLAELESSKEAAIRLIQNDIDALTLAIKLADVAQNGKPARKAPAKRAVSTERQTRQAPGGGPSIADRAAVYLSAAGESSASAIAKSLQLANPTTIYSVLSNDDRFEKTGRGMYKLA